MKIDRPIAIAVILLATVLFASFLVMPEYKKFLSLRVELGEKKAEYNAEFEYYAAIAKTYYDLKSRLDDVQKIDDALPQDASLGKLIYFFQNAATQNGMIIKNLFLSKSSSNPAVTGASENVKDLIFSMDLLGDYSSMQNFIVSLEKSARIFEVLTISFNAGSQAQASSSSSFQSQTNPIYSYNLQVKTHSY